MVRVISVSDRALWIGRPIRERAKCGCGFSMPAEAFPHRRGLPQEPSRKLVWAIVACAGGKLRSGFPAFRWPPCPDTWAESSFRAGIEVLHRRIWPGPPRSGACSPHAGPCGVFRPSAQRLPPVQRLRRHSRRKKKLRNGALRREKACVNETLRAALPRLIAAAISEALLGSYSAKRGQGASRLGRPCQTCYGRRLQARPATAKAAASSISRLPGSGTTSRPPWRLSPPSEGPW